MAWVFRTELGAISHIGGSHECDRSQTQLRGEVRGFSKGKMGFFSDGGIHWTEDGTNGLSFADTTVKIREAQLKCVKEMMYGRTIANKAGTSWVLNDDFTFGYMPWHDMGRKDMELYVFSIRHEMNGKPPKACVLVSFAPTQLMSDSITGAFLGDETAKANLKALEKAGIVTIMDD